MISDGQLEQNLQQGEIAARERGLRGTCRALIGCGIATAALFWGFVIVAFLLPADETAANYDAIAVVLAVLFLILAGISIATSLRLTNCLAAVTYWLPGPKIL